MSIRGYHFTNVINKAAFKLCYIDEKLPDAVIVNGLRLENKVLRKNLKFALKKISFRSPGSLQDWPIESQSQLFQLLPEVEASIGVRLNKSFLMIPTKSVSRIYFQTEVSLFNCQLCLRGKCPGRKARYNEDLARKYGIIE